MKIFEKVVIIIILIATVLIGTPIKYNCIYFNFAIIAIGIIFVLYNSIFKKKKIIENKLDIAILILCLSPIIPLIFGTYVSFNDTLEYLLKYFSCFSIYIILKQVFKNNPKSIKNIVTTFIFSSVILSIIGIDDMTTRLLSSTLEKVGMPHMVNFGKTMSANLGYSNSFAIILAVSIILILDKLSTERKPIYFSILCLNLSILLFTNSRGVWLIFAIIFIISLIINKDKTKSIYNLYLIILRLK